VARCWDSQWQYENRRDRFETRGETETEQGEAMALAIKTFAEYWWYVLLVAFGPAQEYPESVLQKPQQKRGQSKVMRECVTRN
jgi:hypothetical protein